MKKLIVLIGLGLIGIYSHAQNVINLDAEFIHANLEHGTRRVVNTIDTICTDSAYVHMSFCNAPGNTNNIQFKGAYGEWMRLGTDQAANIGDGIHIISEFYTKSTSTADTVYIWVQKIK